MTNPEVEANNFRRLIPEFERRFPDLGHQIDEGMAVAIDGEIFQDAYLASLNPDSEIFLISQNRRRLSFAANCAPSLPGPWKNERKKNSSGWTRY